MEGVGKSKMMEQSLNCDTTCVSTLSAFEHASLWVGDGKAFFTIWNSVFNSVLPFLLVGMDYDRWLIEERREREKELRRV